MISQKYIKENVTYPFDAANSDRVRKTQTQTLYTQKC